MLTDEFRERLRLGKYSRWAENLEEEQLEALFWAVGEYGQRADGMLKMLRQCTPRDPFAYARAMLALEVLADFTIGKAVNLDQLMERVRASRADFCAEQESQPPTDIEAGT